MSTKLPPRVLLLALAILPITTMRLNAQDHPSLSEVLPPAFEDVDDIELIENWSADTIILVGTPGDDKIQVEVNRAGIRFWVNDDSVGRLRQDDLPPDPLEDDQATMGDDPRRFLKIIVAGSGGNDCIFLRADDSLGPPVNLWGRAAFTLYGGDGFDFISTDGVDQVRLVGGAGIDMLIGDGFESHYLGSELLITDLELLSGIAAPDGSKDRIIPGNPESTAYRNCLLHFTPVLYTSPTIKVLDKNPPKLPHLPSIVSREKGDNPTPQLIVFDTILLDQDEVINDVGCLVYDLIFCEDGSMMDPVLVE